MHIEEHSTGVADAIVTEDYSRAWQFLRAIKSAAVYVNASTRFTDGAEFGLGAEVGISTAKTYNRGPLGVKELTVTKYVVFGHGQIRENLTLSAGLIRDTKNEKRRAADAPRVFFCYTY